jgi:outer membrane protein insertion porin family
MGRTLSAAVMFVALAGVASAQTSRTRPTMRSNPVATAPTKFPIASIVIKGNKNLPSEQIIAVSGLKIGEQADKPRFEEARKALEATGMFDSVGYQFESSEDGKGYVATFNVDEVSPLYRVQFEGFNASAADINKYIQSKEVLYNGKLPPTTYIIDRVTREVEQYLASINHPEKVITKVMPAGADEYDLVFRTGAPLPTIAEVTFEGNKAVLITDLEHAINEVAYGTAYSEYNFKLLLDNQIRPLYETKGYLAVKFQNISVEPAKQVRGVVVHLTVDEGPVFKLAHVTLVGVKKDEATDLGNIAKFKINDVAKFDEINESVDRMKKSLLREGYIHTEADVQRTLDNDKKTVDLRIKFTTGPQFHYGKLTIAGLDLDGNAVIEKLWTGKPGKPYNAEYPDFFLTRVKEQGLFDDLGDMKADKKVDEENHVVDVTLTFKASPVKKERRKERQPGSPF